MLETAIICLSMNIYFEARGEPTEGQLAVAMVTLNRAKRKKDRICPEVYRYAQFSWTLASPLPIDEPQAFLKAEKLAYRAFKLKDFTGGATHFHSVYIRPWWTKSPKMVYIGQWGNHLFYKEIK